MDAIKPYRRPRRRRRRRMRPPPIFSGDSSAPPPLPVEPYEQIMDRFNQLLDWEIPKLPTSTNVSSDDISERYSDRSYSPPYEDSYDHRQSIPSKRRRIESFDLRNRLLQQNKRDYDCRDLNETLRDRDRWQPGYESQHRRVGQGTGRGTDMRDRLIEQRSKAWSDSKLPDRDGHFYRDSLDRDHRPDELSPVYQRQVKEYWPDPRANQVQNRFNTGDGYLNQNEAYDERFFPQEDFRKRDTDRYPEKESERYSYRDIDRNNDRDTGRYSGKKSDSIDLEPWHRDHVKYADHSNTRYLSQDCYNNSRNDHTLAGPSYERPRSPPRAGSYIDSLQPAGDPQLMTPQDEDLMVVIHKPELVRFTFTEGDIVKSMLIDLVVDYGDPNRMPEFVSSGLMKSGRAFYVNCRTEETMEWLLKQKLPLLNGIPLLMRRKNIYQMKVSAYAPRCTRTKEEVIKLLRLQNGKKGFNFDNWVMRSYNSTPSGIYFAFDIPSEDAQLLKELGCQLSFELKTLTFKLSSNRVNPISEFPLY